MTHSSTPMADDESPDAQAVLIEAENVIRNAQENDAINPVMGVVARLAVLMKVFRATMKESGFSDAFIEERCAEIFNVFIRPRSPRKDSE